MTSAWSHASSHAGRSGHATGQSRIRVLPHLRDSGIRKAWNLAENAAPPMAKKGTRHHPGDPALPEERRHAARKTPLHPAYPPGARCLEYTHES